MPSLGSGLSLGTISRFPGYDFDASAFALANGVPDSFSAPIYGKNLLGYSNEFRFSATAGYWKGSATAGALVTIGARNISDPFGTNTAVEVFQTNQAYGRILRGNDDTGGTNAPWLVASTKYVLSFYAKSGNYDYAGARIGGRGASNTDSYVTFNLTNGQATTITPTFGTIHSASATSVGNGWYRCVLVYTTPANPGDQNANFVDIAMPTSGNATGTSGDATKYIYLCAVQLEQGDTASTYSPVSGAPFSNPATENIVSYDLINPRKQLNDFVVGVKNMGLWNNMVCWPLRSFQNASGSVLSSLGGYGLYNATKTNNPSTTAIGMVSTNGNQVLTHSPLPFGTGAFSFYTASRALGFSGYMGVAGGFDFAPVAGFGAYYFGYYVTQNYNIRMDFEIDSENATTFSRVFNTPYVVQNNFNSFVYTRNGQTLKTYVNTSLNGTNSGLGANSNMTRTGTTALLNRVQANANNANIIPFSAYFAGVELTSTQITDFHNLYKSTLGYGLSYL